MKVQIDYHIEGTLEIKAEDFEKAEDLFRELSDKEKIDSLYMEVCIDEMREIK
jgi:hypothetical protein